MSRKTNKSVPHPVKTDHEIGQDNITPFGLDIHNPVFLISGISTLVFVAVTLMFQDGAARTDWAPLGAASGDAIAARDLGMVATIFHSALHPWAIYAVVALWLALF